MQVSSCLISFSARVAVETFPILAVHPHTLAAHLQIGQETHSFTMWSFCSREHNQCCHITSLLVDPLRLVGTQLSEWKGSPLLLPTPAPECLHLHNLDFDSWRTTYRRVAGKEKSVIWRRQFYWEGDNIFGDDLWILQTLSDESKDPNSMTATRWLRQGTETISGIRFY